MLTEVATTRQRRSQRRTYESTLSLYDVTLPTRRAIRKLYRHLIELTYMLRPWLDTPDYPTAVAETRLRTFVRTAKWPRIIETLLHLAPLTHRNNDRVLRVIHDIRGGALTSLTLYLQMAEQGDLLARDIPQMVLLANDHAKILRSMIVDLDRIRYTLDELFVPQPIDVIPATWHAKHYRIPSGHTAWLTVECPVQGYIAESMIELAALERVLYNLVNNAVLHCAQPQVSIRLAPSPLFSDMVMIEVANTIDGAQYQRLAQMCPDANWNRLVHDAFSTTGSGLGLGICADIVAHMCGMDHIAQVITAGHFHVHVTPTRFHVQFAWPLVDPLP